MTAPNIELVRHMQWWALRMACEELRYGDTDMPPAPPLSYEDARLVHQWLGDCADHVAPRPQVNIVYLDPAVTA